MSPPAVLPPHADAAIAALRRARRVTVLTGAGVSAESGIPTFRDALTGLWSRYRPEELATPAAFARQPGLVWAWYRERRLRVRAAAPNAAHHALARLERLVPDFTLVTQNVDGLHRRAGSTRVLELHGDITRVRCSRCTAPARPWEDEPAGTEAAAGTAAGTAAGDAAGDAAPPPCERCGAPLRPDVVWFGEALPERELRAAWAAAEGCDVFLSVGTSNVVEPAASLPWLAAAAGATVLVVNPDPSGQRTGPGIVPLVGPAGSVLPALLEAAWPGAS